MKKFELEGDYAVTLGKPEWMETDKGMSLKIPCIEAPSSEHPEGRGDNFFLHFTGTILTSGQNQGKKLWEVSQQHCIDLGMSEPFCPTKIGEIEGAEAVLVMKNDTFKGKTTLKPMYLNAPRANRLSPDQAKDIFAKMTGGFKPGKPMSAAPKPKNEPAAPADPGDDIPFDN